MNILTFTYIVYAQNIQRCWECNIEKKKAINKRSSKTYDKTKYAISLIRLVLF